LQHSVNAVKSDKDSGKDKECRGKRKS